MSSPAHNPTTGATCTTAALASGICSTVGNTPLNQDHEERKQRLDFVLRLPLSKLTETSAPKDQAWEIVETWLRDRGFTVRHATVAVPIDLKLMEGWAGFLKWDKEAKRFYRSEDYYVDYNISTTDQLVRWEDLNKAKSRVTIFFDNHNFLGYNYRNSKSYDSPLP